MKTNQDYKNAALNALKGNWPNAVVGVIVYLAIGLTFEFCIPEYLPVGVQLCVLAASFVLAIFVTWPLEVGIFNSFKCHDSIYSGR